MKKVVLLLVLFIHIAGMLPSCKKETSCEGCRGNKPPISIAGPDQVITLPIDSVMLDGSASSDPDGRISEWLWKQISGPASFNIIKPSDSTTKVKNLVPGIYQFELKVTDDKGLSTNDTMQVIVDAVITSNHQPVANAGPDQNIVLPTNAVSLNGSNSTDPDNNINSYLWAKISGPSSFNITNANAMQTQVINLIEGTYQFELKVTDAGGLFSKDTMQVRVNVQPTVATCDNSNRAPINAQLVPIGNLSLPGTGMAVASAGNKILFAGGTRTQTDGSTDRSSRVDIYDITTQTWSTTELSEPRFELAATVSGNKIFFGGGETDDGCCHLDVVDIYDASTNTWTLSHMPTPGYHMGAVTLGNKVFFAGADPDFTGINIYDINTQSWSTASLSERKERLSAVVANNKAYFAGGITLGYSPVEYHPSNIIDIYDNGTNSWSTSTLYEPKSAFAGITIADKVYWAGGHTNFFNPSCVVEIKDINTGDSSLQYLFEPDMWYNINSCNAVVKDNKIIFIGDFEQTFISNGNNNKFDIYDITTNTWSIGVLPFNVMGASIIAVNNNIYVAGGWVNNGALSSQVWKLEF
jgi:N-acetylneuraminic acid mutarotase